MADHEGDKPMKPTMLTAAVMATLMVLGACGGGGGGETQPVVTPDPAPDEPPPGVEPPPQEPMPTDPTANPSYHLGTARFTTHQPRVLEQIGAHHAYARGLTGRGVRIGIDDTIVDYTQRAEFGSRVRLRDADGAQLSYLHPFGDDYFSDVGACERSLTCQLWDGNSGGKPEAYNRWVRQIVSEDGWPTQDDSVFFVDEYYSQYDPLESLYRWREVPTPYGEGDHGTIVASVAAGNTFGVAPESTIIPIAQNLSDDQRADALATSVIRNAIAALPAADRYIFDSELARDTRDEYAKFDIINRSYGRPLFDPDAVSSAVYTELRWYSLYLPQYLAAVLQTDRPAAHKTILVYAAGNEGQPYSGLGADLPYYIPELRGHSLAVAATDPGTGVIASWSNRCGSLPDDWSSASHGRHYCLTAPGVVRGLVPNPYSPGRGDAEDGISGTSFAAPVVSGSLALMMEHFRGTRGNTAIVRRMLDTADHSGRYADLEIYGAGHLDLEAALSPVGTLNAGQAAQALSRTALHVPAAYGAVAGRVASLELASFDEQDFPFWIPVTTLVATAPVGRSPIPRFVGDDTLATDPDAVGLHWMPVADDGSLWLSDGHGWVSGFGPSSASLARLPDDDGWGYGLSFDGGGYLGSRTSGAFGSDPRSGMIWTSRAFQHELDGGWRLDVTGTLALGAPQYEDDAIFQASPSVLSAMAMRLGTDSWGLTVEQPLRAETGTGTFRIENGHIEDGRRLYDAYRIPLAPDAREIRVTLRHEREALGGDVAVEVSGAADAGHVSGEGAASVGLAYRTSW